MSNSSGRIGEVPVMLILVKIANSTVGWFQKNELPQSLRI